MQQQAGALRGLAAAGHARKGGREDLAGGRLSRRVQDPAAEAERKAAQEKMYSLDMGKVTRGGHLSALLTSLKAASKLSLSRACTAHEAHPRLALAVILDGLPVLLNVTVWSFCGLDAMCSREPDKLCCLLT